MPQMLKFGIPRNLKVVGYLSNTFLTNNFNQFRMRRFTILLVLLLGLFQISFAQQNIVRGTIQDSESFPVIGAGVIVSGTSRGTVTDENGNFSLPASTGEELTITSIGYITQTIKVGNGPLKIVMAEDHESLDEVVIVGMSIKTKDLTGAVGSVDGKTLNEKPVTSLNEAMQGRVAGVFITNPANPSDDAGIRIRGINTINSGSSPIYVVDGLVMEDSYGAFNSINPNDIEHVEVLKDASATALYGSRGANGVVLITTKKGTSREGSVSYDGWVSITSIANIPDVMDGTDLANLRIDAFANGYLRNNPSADRQSYVNNTLLGTNLAFSEQEFSSYHSATGQWDTYNWLKEVTHPGIKHNHNVSFSKAFDNARIYTSFNYSNNNGLIDGSNQDTYSGRINLEYNVKPWLKVGTNTQFTVRNDAIPSNDIYNKALNANPLLNFAPYKDDATRFNKEYLTIYYQALSESYNNEYNPFNSQELSNDRSRKRFYSSNYINIEPIKGLNIRSTFAYNFVSQTSFQYTPSYVQESIRHESGDANAYHNRAEQSSWQWDNTITYDIKKGLHTVNLMAGSNMSQRTGNNTTARGYRFASDDLGYNVLGGAAAFEKTVIGSNFSTSALMSFLVRGNYNFDNRFFLTATARYDGSTKFAKGHKWGLFPSFSAAWNIKNEKFLKSVRAVDALKLRVGYGIVGNQDIADFAYASWYSPTTSRVSVDGATVGQAGYKAGTSRGTPDISWERQKQFNTGLDFGFFKGRFSGSFDIFHIKNDGLLMSHNLSKTTGYSTTTENIGEVINNGFELSLNGTLIRTNNIVWNMGANISHDRNRVTKLYGDTEEILSGSRTGNIFLGQPLHTIYTYKYGGIANESNKEEWSSLSYPGRTVELGSLYLQDISSATGEPDGTVNTYDREICGKTDPDFYGGFFTDFSYKNFSVNAVFNYVLGVDVISGYYETLINSVGLSPASPDIADRWTPENTGAKFPKVITNSSGYNPYRPTDCEMSIQNGSFLRLSTLTVSYHLNTSVLAKAHIKRLRIYATGSNLFCLTSYKGFDPETGDNNYPPTRAITFGVNFGF